jgi:hypothetical protein
MTSHIENLRKTVGQLPVIGPAVKSIYRSLLGQPPRLEFETSGQYWEDRYSLGGNSGAGSYGRLAQFKAETINSFIEEHGIKTVIELGSGDGAQLALARYPAYVGIDIAATAIEACRVKFAHDPTKRFVMASDREAKQIRAELAMSLDVIYHLVEDNVFHEYMNRLISAADRFVCIYSSNIDRLSPDKHVRHRIFTDWLAKNAPTWKLILRRDNPFPEDPSNPDHTSWADFYFFQNN